MTEKGQAAPWPYNSLEISADTASSGYHIYVTDATGRKFAAIWGKADEKAFTADLLLRAVNSYETMRTALEEILEGKGAFSRDPLTHASNTIDDMKEIARKALAADGDVK